MALRVLGWGKPTTTTTATKLPHIFRDGCEIIHEGCEFSHLSNVSARAPTVNWRLNWEDLTPSFFSVGWFVTVGNPASFLDVPLNFWCQFEKRISAITHFCQHPRRVSHSDHTTGNFSTAWSRIRTGDFNAAQIGALIFRGVWINWRLRRNNWKAAEIENRLRKSLIQ